MNIFLQKRMAVGILLIIFSLAILFLHLLPVVFLKTSVERTGETFLIQQITHHGDSAIYYIPRAREISDGHFPVSDLHVPENKNGMPFIFPPGPHLLLGGLIAVFGDTQWGYIAATLIFPLIMFLLFFWLGRILWQNMLASLLFASIAVFTPIVSHIPKIFFGFQVFLDTVVKNFVPVVRTPILGSFLLRAEDPLLTLWLYILAFALLYLFWREPTPRRTLFFGIAAGLLLYFYLFYWLFIIVAAGLLFLYDSFWAKRITFTRWLFVFIPIGIIAIPYIINFLILRSLPQAEDLILRLGLEHGWGFRISVWRHYFAYLGLGLAGFFLLRKKEPHTFSFLAVSLAAMVVLWNMQLVFGRNVAVDHWPKAFALPYFAFLALLVARFSAEAIRFLRRPWIGNALGVVAVLLIALLFAKKAVNAVVFLNPPKEWVSASSFDSYAFPKTIFDSWAWINQNVPPESSVLTNSFVTSVYLSGYTSVNSYLPHVQNTLLGTFDLEQRFLIVQKLFGTTAEELRAFLMNDRERLFGGCAASCDSHALWNRYMIPEYLYAHTFNVEQTAFDSLRDVPGYYTVPGERIHELLRRYEALRPQWTDFRGSYVYYGPWERMNPRVRLREDPLLERMFNNEDVEIYRVK